MLEVGRMMSQMEVLPFNNVLREALLRKRCAETFFFFSLLSSLCISTHMFAVRSEQRRDSALFYSLRLLRVVTSVRAYRRIERTLSFFFSFLIVALYIQGSLNFCNSHVCINTQQHTQLITPLVMLTSLVALVTADRRMFTRNKKNENYRDETSCNDHTKEGKRSEGETEKKKINMKRGNTEERLRSVTISLSCNF